MIGQASQHDADGTDPLLHSSGLPGAAALFGRPQRRQYRHARQQDRPDRMWQRARTCCSCHCAAAHGRRAAADAASLACKASSKGAEAGMQCLMRLGVKNFGPPPSGFQDMPGNASPWERQRNDRALVRKEQRRRRRHSPPVLARRRAWPVQHPAAPRSCAACHHTELPPARLERRKPCKGWRDSSDRFAAC